jgi:hypothetical protein
MTTKINIRVENASRSELQAEGTKGVAVTSVTTFALPKGAGMVYARIYTVRDQEHADAFLAGTAEPDLQGQFIRSDLARQYAAMLLVAADQADADKATKN